MVSVLYGLSSLPFVARLAGAPSLFTGYLNGEVQSTLSQFIKIFWANTQSYVLWNRTIEYGLAFLALALLFNYLHNDKRNGNFSCLLVGILFLNAALFTHSAFLAIPVLSTILIYSLLQPSCKRKLLNISIVFALFFLSLILITNSSFLNQLLTLVEYSLFSIGDSNAIQKLGILMLILFPTFILILFRDELKIKINFSSFRKVKKFHLTMPNKIQRWIIALLFVSLSLFLCYLNYDNLYTNTMASASNPWFVWVAYFGLQIALIIVYLPIVFRKSERRSIFFLLSFIFSIVALSVLSCLQIVVFVSGLGAMYLFFMAYPLSCIAGIALSIYSSSSTNPPKEPTKNKPFRIGLSKNKRKLFYTIVTTFLLLSIAASFLSYAYSVSIDYPQDLTRPRLSTSDATILQLMYNSLPKSSVIIALSENSYQMLCSILPNKILPIYLNINEGPAGGTWARNAVLESSLPEAVLSSLYQLGATDVFVSSADASLFSNSNTTFASLVNDFPIKYSSDNVKLYKIPSILYSDSNYHLVSGLNGYPSKQPVFIDVDPSPTVIFPTNQSTFWEVTALDEGKGSIGLPVLSEDSVEACGNRRLMISVGSGTYSRWQIKHSFNVSQDWYIIDT